MTGDFITRLERLIGEAGSAIPKNVTIDCNRFFSGAAAYANGRIFMSLSPSGLALKLAERDRDALFSKGGTPLRYFPKAPIKKAYVVAPEKLAANPEELEPWINRSIAYALTLPKPKKKPKKP